MLDTNVYGFGTVMTEHKKLTRKRFYLLTKNVNYHDVFTVKIHSTEAKYNGAFGDVAVEIPSYEQGVIAPWN